MAVLLTVAILGTVLLGFLLMRSLDRFLEEGGIGDSGRSRANQGMLVYGAPDVAEKMHRHGMKCTVLGTPCFPDDGYYSALLALSREDGENLAVCHAARRADPGITMIARCSAPELRAVFQDAGVNRLLDAGESVDSLLTELWGADR